MRIYQPKSAFNVAEDWGIDLVRDYPIKIAAVPVFFNQSFDFSYDDSAKDLTLKDFDLVVLSDIEFRRQREIKDWAEQQGIQRYIVAVGGLEHNTNLENNAVYRPWWSYNILRYNQPDKFDDSPRPFLYDALLGARRPHRDFVALASQHYGLDQQAIITYRSVFPGEIVNWLSDEAQDLFKDTQLPWPFISPNLDHRWEVADQITNSISPCVPWEIWRRTYFSVVCETLGFGDTFFMSEKTGKAIYGRRMFVMFSTPGFLKHLKKLGFQTFSDIIDESYDDIEYRDLIRWQAAFEQVRYLCTLDLDKVLAHVAPILEHNYNRLLELQKETRGRMRDLFNSALN